MQTYKEFRKNVTCSVGMSSKMQLSAPIFIHSVIVYKCIDYRVMYKCCMAYAFLANLGHLNDFQNILGEHCLLHSCSLC